ncbi:UPF0606 protein KIAA1549L homolog isoform X4 [Dromaius novaehollandiae]|nr:UPF0606 protein KIAA1549L homolog isoform X1 [Dromaius novaehollandiae]
MLSPTRPFTETKTSSVVDISMGQTLENANLLQMIRTTLTGTRARTVDQTNLSPTLYQGSGNSASQEPAEVSADSPLRSSSQDADEPAAVSGLPQLGMFATLFTTPSMTHSSTAVPFQLMPLETPSISKESTSGSDILAAVPSPSFSSLIIQSPHTINFRKSALLPIKMPLSTDPESSFNTDSTNSQVSGSRNSPLSLVTVVNSSMVNRTLSRKGPRLFTGTMSFNLFGSTTMHFTKIMGKESSSERTSLLSVYSDTPVSIIMYQSSAPVTSRSASWFPNESVYNVSSTGGKPNNRPFKAMLTDRTNGTTPSLSSPVFQNNAEIPASFFHPVSAAHKISKMSYPQPSTALTNCTTSSTRAAFMSSASESPVKVSSSTENTSGVLLPISFIPDADNTGSTVLRILALTSETDFLLRNTTHSHSTSTVSALQTETNQTFTMATHMSNTSAAAAYEDPLVTISLHHSVLTMNQTFAKDLTDRTYEAKGMLLPAASGRIPISDGSPVTRTARRSFMRGVTAKISTINANSVLPYESLSKVSLNIQASKLAKGSRITSSVSEAEMTSPDLAAVSLITSLERLSKPELAITNTSAINISMTVHLPPANAGSPEVTENEESNMRVPAAVTPHTEHSPLSALNQSNFTSGHTSHSIDTKHFTSVVPSEWRTLPPSVSMTKMIDSHRSGFSHISSAVFESNVEPRNSSEVAASVSKWTSTALVSSTNVNIPSVKTSVKMLIREVPRSTSPLETEYHTSYSKVSGLQNKTNRNKQLFLSAASTNYTSATSSQNISNLASSGTKSNSFPEFGIHALGLKTSPVQYSSLATTMMIPDALQKNHGSITENFTGFFTVGNINVTTEYKTPLQLHVPSLNDTGVFPSTLESQTNAGKVTLLTKTLNATPAQAFEFTDNLTLSANYGVSSDESLLRTKSPFPVTRLSSSSTHMHSFITEEDISSGNMPEFADNGLESSGYLITVDKNPATFSMEEWHTNVTRHSLVPINMSNKATQGIPLQTPVTSALQSVIITSVHASPTHLTSTSLSTTNFTHSVITVLSGVSSGAIPTVGTSEAKQITRKSSPTSPVPTSSFFSLGTENTPLPSVMALSTPILTLTKNNTTAKLTSILSSVGTHTDFPFATRNTTASPMEMTAILIPPKSSTIAASTLASTVHAPRQIKTTVTDTQKFPSSEITKTSTPYPLTITAALTSITASAKTTRLPPTPVESTSALPETAAASLASVTAALPLECHLSGNQMLKTVLLLNTRRLLISNSFKESVTKGLNQVLRQAFNQNVSAQVEILEQSNNVTVGYYVTRERLVFMPAAVIERLIAYGISNATADIKQHVPNLQSVAVLALPWNPLPAYHFQLKTELQFVGQTDNIQSCKFVQTMEQRLQRAFQDAERKVLNTSNNLTVQILNTSNVSQAVTLFYVVSNQSTTLNGTISSNLLNQLSAELVGFYLTYPPLTIAESLEYPNLDVSESTRDYWVITVIQGVDITLLGLNNQSFARLMEQRLAPLFMMSHQQGRRFKRATTVGSYTVQMVKIQRIPGPKEPAELTYYTLYNGKPLLGTAAAKILSTVDSQRMALTLGYVIQVQADPVVKNPPNNLWIIAAVLAPIAVVTVIIIIITAVLCRKNKNDFKPDTMMNLPQRAKPVQGFDYAKQHLGQQGAEDEVLPVTQETVVLPLPVRDVPASQEREITQDGSTIKTAKSNETRKSRSPSQNGSVITTESGKPSSGRSSPQKVMAQQKVTKDEGRKRNVRCALVPVSDEEEGGILFDNIAKPAIDPFDTSSGSVQLIAIKPVALPAVHAASDRSQESAIINGEVNKALKQKSDIEHYRNKLRLKAKRKGYYDFPQADNNKGLTERKRMYEKNQKEIDHILDPDTDISSPFAEPKNRQQMKSSVYRSRQSLNSPSPGETEMDLLVTRERPRRGIRNSGYDTEPEIIEETNVDRVNEPRGYTRSRQAKGHSETSTLSSQPSIDEVRQQMHMLLEEAFSLASAGHGGQSRQDAYSSAPHLPYSEVVTSAPGTMTRPRGGVQWVPTYRPEMYQYSLPRPAYRFSQLPEMVMGSPPPPVPPRTGPVAVASLRRSTSDIGSKVRIPESSGVDQAQHHDQASFAPGSRAPVSVGPLDQSAFHSGNTVPAVFAIPAANRPGFTGYFIPTPPTAYRNQAWMPYAGENELPGQWADSVPLPGYIEAYPRPRYQHNSPSRLPRQYSQSASMHPSLEQAPLPSTAASQQSLTENDPSDAPLTNISTAALVKAIREEVAKLAKKQTDMFEFQV